MRVPWIRWSPYALGILVELAAGLSLTVTILSFWVDWYVPLHLAVRIILAAMAIATIFLSGLGWVLGGRRIVGWALVITRPIVVGLFVSAIALPAGMREDDDCRRSYVNDGDVRACERSVTIGLKVVSSAAAGWSLALVGGLALLGAPRGDRTASAHRELP
jgi:hypothetical protein